jgi:hypothetical protein
MGLNILVIDPNIFVVDSKRCVMDHNIFVMEPNIFVMEPNIFVMDPNVHICYGTKLRYHTILLTKRYHIIVCSEECCTSL